ncbi:MAG: ferritin-like domain-containing protein [Proteobacteria bacterium]|nr:ferritin-like domain-containing protein [Pseudomonadota bacterium]
MTSWTLDDIPWQDFDAAKVNADVLQVIKTAALVERNGADYGLYLANVFAGDTEFCTAAERWATEEEQHGAALGRWAERADPDFDFQTAFSRFKELYRIPVEATQSVRGSRAGELCARCVVETGTSSFYSAIRDAVEEPVLRAICKKIAADEFRHYKLFATHLARYLSRESMPTWQRLKVVVSRFRETSDDELASAYYAGNAPAAPYDCQSANAAYTARALAFYDERHVRRAGYMMAQTAGLAPDGWVTRILTRLLWWFIAAKGRKCRPLLTA